MITEKKGFHASRCACGQFAKSYKTDGFLLKDSALCLIAVSTLKDVVFCRKLCTFKVIVFVILSPCLLLFQYLNLLNGERLYLSEYVKLIFETDDLTDASPSTVSRCVSMVIVPLIVIRSQFWILETAASFCQIEVPSHRFLIIIGALDTNITYKDKLALALRQSDERLILENSALKSLYGGQCTLSTQLIKPKLSCCTPLPTQHHCFLKTYPI